MCLWNEQSNIRYNLASFQSLFRGTPAACSVSTFTPGRAQQRITLEPAALIVAGWTGRDEAALRHHIEELAAIGVPRPSSVPVFYRNSILNLTQAPVIEVLGPDTSGEVEPVIVARRGPALSDRRVRPYRPQGRDPGHCAVEAALRQAAWPRSLALDEVVDHWDQLKLRSFATIDGKRLAYQDGTLAGMRPPADLIARYGSALAPDTVMFCGTLAAIGGIRPASRFEMELEDPVLGRTLQHAYDIDVLPVIS